MISAPGLQLAAESPAHPIESDLSAPLEIETISFLPIEIFNCSSPEEASTCAALMNMMANMITANTKQKVTECAPFLLAILIYYCWNDVIDPLYLIIREIDRSLCCVSEIERFNCIYSCRFAKFWLVSCEMKMRDRCSFNFQK